MSRVHSAFALSLSSSYVSIVCWNTSTAEASHQQLHVSDWLLLLLLNPFPNC